MTIVPKQIRLVPKAVGFTYRDDAGRIVEVRPTRNRRRIRHVMLAFPNARPYYTQTKCVLVANCLLEIFGLLFGVRMFVQDNTYGIKL